MLAITNLSGETEIVTNIKEFKRKRMVNGEKTISFVVLPDKSNEHSYYLVDTESRFNFENEEYIIKNVVEKSIGNKTVKKIEAVHVFFNDMINSQQYRIHNGSMTFNAALNFVFENTDYEFSIIDPTTAESFENFGKENCLALFKKVLERYGMEFYVVGKTVFLKREIGVKTDFQFRYKLNIKNIEKDIDTSKLATVIRGYAGEPEDGVYPIEEEYISPNIEYIGRLEADPYTSESMKRDRLKSKLREVLIDEPQVSLTIDFVDLRASGYNQGAPSEGDYGRILYEPMNDLNIEARIVEIEEEYNGKLKPIHTSVVISNIRETATKKMTRFQQTQRKVNDVFEGKQKLPYNVLDDAVRNATETLQSAQTELTFDNGILSIDKLNPNEVVILNSKGLGISRDGGQTVTTAMTGRGIVADVITGGQINANNVTIYGGDKNDYTYINGSLLESKGRHTRSWRGKTETNQVRLMMQNGYFRARNDTLNRSLYFSDFGISTYADAVGNEDASGTLAFRDTTYSTAKGLTVHSVYGVVALRSDENRVILDSKYTINLDSDESSIYMRPMKTSRPGINEFRFWIKDGGSPSDTDGVLTYGSPNTNYAAGIRFQKTSVGPATVYLTNGNGDMGTGSLNCWDIQANSLRTTNIDNGRDFYIGVSTGELRVTNNLFWNGGDTGYKSVRASGFIEASSQEFKTDISPWNYDALSVLRNETQLYQYKMISDVEDGLSLYKRGVIVERETPAEFVNGKGVSHYEMINFAIRSIQQIGDKLDDYEYRLTQLEGEK